MTTTLPRHLILPATIFGSMVHHAEQALPHEAVGLLGGEADGRAGRLVPLKNIAPPGSFFVDPYSQYTALRTLTSAGLAPLAMYHSHPGGCAHLSDRDLHYALPHDLIQVVLALARADLRQPDVRAYRLTADTVVRIPLKIASAAGTRDAQCSRSYLEHNLAFSDSNDGA